MSLNLRRAIVLNVYDFDKTIYDGDSTIDFFFYSLKKDIKLLRFFPKQFLSFIFYKLKIISKTEFKREFFSFLKGIENIDEYLQTFWSIHKTKIKKWYLDKQECDDVIVSASPEFLLIPICKELNINRLIASKVCIKTGEFKGNNCYGEEKAIRFFEKFPDGKIDNFYSDSISDLPLAKKSKFAFLVQKDRIVEFNGHVKLKKHFFNIRFAKFFAIGILNATNGVLFASLFSLFILQANIAFILGYITTLSISYLLNAYFVFSERKLYFSKFLRFCISYLPNFVLQNIIVYILTIFFKTSKLIVFFISTVVSFPLTYLFLSFFTFRNKKY